MTVRDVLKTIDHSDEVYLCINQFDNKPVCATGAILQEILNADVLNTEVFQISVQDEFLTIHIDHVEFDDEEYTIPF